MTESKHSKAFSRWPRAGAGYWSGTADGDDGWRMLLRYDGDWSSEWYSESQDYPYLVRPVLK